MQDVIFSIDFRAIFHWAAGVFRKMILHSLRFNLVCVNCKYLANVPSWSKFSLMRNSKCSLSGNKPASIFKAELNVALYTIVII